MNEELKILIVDDHDIVREGIKLLIQAHTQLPIKIITANSAKDALRKFNSNRFDLVFTDIKMPEMDGIELTRQLVKNFNAKVIAVSMHSEVAFAQKMLEAGAKGYLLKNANVDELEKAIEKVLDNGMYFTAEVSNELLSLKTEKKKTKNNQPAGPHLTPRENEVLQLILQEHTNEQIASQLNCSKRTIDNHRQNILNKFNAKNTAGLIKILIDKNII